MKKQIAATLLLIIFNVSLASAQQTVTRDFHDTPLLEALGLISHEQADYTIDILADGLDDLTTSARVKNQTVPDAIRKICALHLKKLVSKLARNGMTVSFDEAALNLLARRSYQPQYGARPVGRAINDGIINPLTMKLIDGTVSKESPIVVSSDGENFLFSN